MADILMAIVYASLSLFIILDPILSVPIFVEITKGMKKREIMKQATLAAAVAGGLLYIFLFFNFVIFSILGIDISSLQVAGGILLFILGMQETFGISIGDIGKHKNNAAGVVIGTPLLCGPGAITTVLVLSKDYGLAIPAIAIAVSVAATWLILHNSSKIQKLLGRVLTEVIGKIMGMLVAAIAVKMIMQGLMALV